MTQIFENLHILLSNQQQVIIRNRIKRGHTLILESIKQITFVIGAKNPKGFAIIHLIIQITLHKGIVMFGDIVIEIAFEIVFYWLQSE
jgi:hypothetical protein